MTRPLLVLRPQPGADTTAAKARAMGLEAVVAPLFRIVPRRWQLRREKFDALLVTSAKAARLIRDRPDRSTPVYAVGEATAEALRKRGFTRVIAGESDVADLARRAARDGVRSMLHLAGEDQTAFDPGSLRIDTRIVYASEPLVPEPAFFAALKEGAVALLHSARAARRFRELAGPGHRIAAISPAVLAAAGDGWEEAVAAERPADDALLAAAARLCH